MPIEFRRPCAEDFRRIDLQDFDAVLSGDIAACAEALEAIALADPGSLTCIHNGRVVGIGGILPTNEAWQFFAKDCRAAFLPMVNRIRKAIICRVLTHGEVWVMIDKDRPNAARWAALLGFDHEEGETWYLRSSAL